MQNRLFFASLLMTSFAVPASAQLVLKAPNPIALHAGKGAVTFTLSNQNPQGANAITLALTPGPILDAATRSEIPGAAVTLAPLVGGPNLPTSITSGQTLSLQASATGISGASTAEFSIFNEGSPLGTPIVEFASDAALALSIDGEGAPDKPLAYTYGNPVVVVLKNGDAQSYHTHWIFQIENLTESSGDLDIPTSGSSRITITPSSKPFSIIDLIHPSNKKGVLLLSVVGPSNPSAGLAPTRTLPVSLVMQSVAPLEQTIWSYAYAVILLLMGGLFSFLGSSMLPNMQKKGDLRARLHILANRTSAVSTLIDSYLRVLLRLERSRIANLIDNAPAWIPASADPLVTASALIDTLSKRLAGAAGLDDLLRKHDQVSATAPPSVTDSIDVILQAAADQLHSSALSDADIAAANALFVKAQAALDMLDDTDALAKQIAGNVASVMTRIEKFPANYYTDLKDLLPGVFIFADPARGYSDAKNITRPMLFAIDHGVAAIHLALDYSMVRASIPLLPVDLAQQTAPLVSDQANNTALAPPAAPVTSASKCDNLGETARKRLFKRQCVLIEFLGTLSWRALRNATLLVQEMREDTYEEDVLDEICKKGQAGITFDTQKTRPFQPVFFAIKFKDSRFNDAAALERLICHWTFPNDIDEYTWKVCHYFTGREHATTPPSEFKETAIPATEVSATSPSLKKWPLISGFSTRTIKKDVELCATIRGQQPDEAREVPVPPLRRTIRIESATTSERSRFWAEFLRFAIAFSVALAGLLSGALEQLNKLDLIPASIAIIGLGFGASSIKNLLTQSAAPQTPTPNPPTPKT
jgi:hypothetical protein